MFWNRDEIPDYVSLDDDLFKRDDGTIISGDEKNIKYEEKTKNNPQKKEKKKLEINFDKGKAINIVVDIVLVSVLIFAFITFFDVIRVSRYGKLPVFATHTFGNSKYDSYSGLGYKVYYYHIDGGKNAIEIGTNSLKYSDKPIVTTAYDLSLLFQNDFDKFAKDYLNKYISITGTVTKKTSKYIYLKYEDESKKYTTTFKCNLIKDKKIKSKEVTVVGMLYDYDRDGKVIYIDNASIK